MSSERVVGPNDRVCVGEGVSAREFDGEWVVLDLVGGNYFGLDNIAGCVWSLLASGRSPADIAAIFVDEYDVSEDRALQDVLCLTDELLKRGLVRVKSST
jgi:hypothetical protein